MNNKLNSKTSAETAADKSGADDITTSSHSSANTFVSCPFGRLLCKLGMHRWEEGFTDSLITPLANKCKRCKIVRVFRMWGYTYHRNASDNDSQR